MAAHAAVARRRCRALALAALVVALGSPAAAQPAFDIQHDANLYGHLRQAATDCAFLGCGPTAAVNSFTYLQNRYPDFYDSGLTPGGPVATANALAGPDYMNTACMACAEPGTKPSYFIMGKIAWFRDHPVPGGYTLVEAMTARPWSHPATPPPGVRTNAYPTIEFLRDQLEDDEDLEIYLQDVCGTGCNHWVTLTGMTFDGLDGGLMTYIDPVDGQKHTVGYSADFSLAGLSILYQVPGTGERHEAIISAAVGESPLGFAPEPGTVVLLGSGLVSILIGDVARRRRAASRRGSG